MWPAALLQKQKLLTTFSQSQTKSMSLILYRSGEQWGPNSIESRYWAFVVITLLQFAFLRILYFVCSFGHELLESVLLWVREGIGF